ncbi:MAG: hypothetical protein ACHP9Z_07655 [Streptosporangiales bacterium]
MTSSRHRSSGQELAALITWLITAFAGLYLLVIWLIEYDVSAPGGAVSRLPRTVITGHVLLATGGLAVWILYLIVDRDVLARIALSALAVVVLLGLTMLGRWLTMRRALAAALRTSTGTGPPAGRATAPIESNFPVPVVLGHGLTRRDHSHPGATHRPRSGQQLTRSAHARGEPRGAKAAETLRAEGFDGPLVMIGEENERPL